MFRQKNFEGILQEMLDSVPEDVDKREGSIIYDALAPTAMELAETYSFMGVLVDLSFADSADGDHLTRRVAEHGVFREEATFSLRKIVVTDTEDDLHNSVPIGSTFMLNDISYTITEQISPGEYEAAADVPGIAGNGDFGVLVPVEPIENLGVAMLSEVLIPGQDEETDEALYDRFLVHINEQPYGGNRADYKRKVLSISGVGGVRLFRTPNGGGTTKVLIIDSDFNAPSSGLVDEVQEILDPTVNQGEGLGLAPIGHRVFVEGVGETTANITTTLTLDGVTVGQIESLVKDELEAYLLSLRQTWGDENSNIVVRTSQIESRLINVQGVVDIGNTRINGAADNLTIAENHIPVLGDVTLHAN